MPDEEQVLDGESGESDTSGAELVAAIAEGMGLGPVPSIGRIVHFVQGDGQHRPAIIVNLFQDLDGKERVQLVVFHDGANDAHTAVVQATAAGVIDAARLSCIEWATSIPHNEDTPKALYTWHWPERI